MFVDAGAHFIAIDFNNVTERTATCCRWPISAAVRIAWIYKNAATFGGDPNRIYLSGHSSGAHLARRLLVTDWEKDYGVPKDIVEGCAAVLGHV